MSFNGTSVGLDVHALSVVAHAVDEETGRVERARLCPDHGEILGWLRQLRGPVRSTVEVPKRRGVHHTSRPTSAGSWHGDEEKVGGITRGRLVAIVGIAVVATAGIVTGIIAALGGF